MAQCAGKTKQGARCKNQAIHDAKYCRMHQFESADTATDSSTEDDGKWQADQTTVSAIGGATLGAVVGGPLGALVGGAVGAFMGNYQGWENIFNQKEEQDEQ